jgi:hypothetical protein
MYTLSGIRAALNDLNDAWYSAGCINAKDPFYQIFISRQMRETSCISAPHQVPDALEKGAGIQVKYMANTR